MTSTELEAKSRALTEVADERLLAGRKLGKRLLDLAVAIPALIASTPILLLAHATDAVGRSGGSVLFRQARIGRGEPSLHNAKAAHHARRQ